MGLPHKYNLFRYRYKILKHRLGREPSTREENYNMSLMSNYSSTQPASFTTFTRYFLSAIFNA